MLGAIPVDDYTVPYNSPHHLHDVWTFVGNINARELAMQPAQYSMRTNTEDHIVSLLSMQRSECVIAKYYHSGFTLLILEHNYRHYIYHAVRGDCNVRVQDYNHRAEASYSSYTGEFIRAIGKMKPRYLPISALWLTPYAVKLLTGHEYPLLERLGTLRRRLKITRQQAYDMLFHDYPTIPNAVRKFLDVMNGYEILHYYGIEPHE